MFFLIQPLEKQKTYFTLFSLSTLFLLGPLPTLCLDHSQDSHRIYNLIDINGSLYGG